MKIKKTICIGVLIISISLFLLLYWYSLPNDEDKYSYYGVKATIIFNNVTVNKQNLYDFLSTNQNITIEQVSIQEENGAPFNHLRFRYISENLTFDNHDFVIWMNTDVLNGDLSINFYYHLDHIITGKNRKDVTQRSNQYFELDRLISENITNNMINEFVKLIKKQPEHFELNKFIEKLETF